MSIFSFQKKLLLQPSWQFDADGVIWRMMFSPSHHLVLEIRDPEKKLASFTCLNDRSGDLFWRDRSFDEPWWIGIEALDDELIFFHKFRKPDMPQHSGVIACDIVSGELIWENTDYVFVQRDGDRVIVQKERFEAIHFYALDSRTGDFIEDLGTDTERINLLRQRDDDESRFKDFRYPSPFLQDDADHVDASIIKREFSDNNLRGAIDYLRYTSYIILSWHERAKTSAPQQELLTQRFCIIGGQSGEKMFEEILLPQTVSIGMDSFFMKGSILYFIKNLHVLTAIDLNNR